MDNNKGWVEKQKNTLMVVATLIATMVFRDGISPPAGVWGDDAPAPAHTHGPSSIFKLIPNTKSTDQSSGHVAGKSILGRHPYHFKAFYVNNTVSFITSLIIIMVLMSGLSTHEWSCVCW